MDTTSGAAAVPLFTLQQGTAPLLISIPHVGTMIPEPIAATMTDAAKSVADCDWHLDRLYAFGTRLGASFLLPSCARYVIDLNRPPDGESLYPGQDTTGLLPLDTFDREPLYLPGQEPDEAELARRLDTYWQPYHEALVAELGVLTARHGQVLLWEAHSIRSQVPRFFDGQLPDFNFGTADGASALPDLAEELQTIVAGYGGYTAVANGRFKGGYITRAYGKPEAGVHAVQLELAQCTYMDESPPYEYDEARAAQVAPLIESVVQAALARVIAGLHAIAGQRCTNCRQLRASAQSG